MINRLIPALPAEQRNGGSGTMAEGSAARCHPNPEEGLLFKLVAGGGWGRRGGGSGAGGHPTPGGGFFFRRGGGGGGGGVTG